MKDIYYEHIFENMKLNFETISSKVTSWYPSGRFEITAKLSDGSKCIYNDLNRTIRNVPRYIEGTDRLTEEAWRREFRYRLQDVMCAKGINQEELSERTGISRVSISNYITGKSAPSAYNIIMIAQALECSVNELGDFNH